MPEFGTIAHLVELAIQGERLAESFYKRVAARFRHYPEVEQFWLEYAAEEDGHARWLERLRERADPERMGSPADLAILEEAQRAGAASLDSLLWSIRTLQDAYEIANELEHAETNAVFEFLISYFTEDGETQAFLRAQLSNHIGRLMIDFPRSVGTGTLRRTILAMGE
jgi:rubrerythrin